MAKFKPLVDSSVKDAEAEVSKYWKDINILEKTLEKGENDPSYVFYEGPPTANGNPGIHHVVARTLKDWVCRYKTMSGYQVQRKAGWDTHGLPVELQVEKELGERGFANGCANEEQPPAKRHIRMCDASS